MYVATVFDIVTRFTTMYIMEVKVTASLVNRSQLMPFSDVKL